MPFVTNLRVQLGKRTSHQAFLLSSSQCRCLLNFLFSLHRLSYLNSVLNLITLLGLFSSLSFSGVEDISHLSVARVYRGMLQTSTIGLQAHMERDGIPIGVLPVRDTSWNVAVFHILGGELAGWRAHNHGRCLFTGATCNLLVLVSRGFQRVLDDI